MPLKNDIKETKLAQHLGLAMRARKLVMGDKLMDGLKQVKLVVLATDASSRTKTMISKKCAFHNVPIVEAISVDRLSQAIGKTNRVAVGVTDAGFAQMIQKTMQGKGEVINESKETKQSQ